jgi:hypothetical protein
VRAIVRIDVDRISDSCGYGLPILRFERERTQLSLWAEKKGEAGLAAHKRQKNGASIDGIPALRFTEPETP